MKLILYVPVGWLDYRCASMSITRPVIPTFVRAFFWSNTWKFRDKGRPRGRLHSDAQVSVGLGNTKGKL